MADPESETLSNKLIQAQKNAKDRRYNDAVNSIYTSIKSNPFVKEVTVSADSREEAVYIEKKLKEDGLSPKINSHFVISQKVTSVEVIIPLPVSKDNE